VHNATHTGAFISENELKLAKMMTGHAPPRSRLQNSKSEASATPRMKKPAVLSGTMTGAERGFDEAA
jgi:hypothetical protein